MGLEVAAVPRRRVATTHASNPALFTLGGQHNVPVRMIEFGGEQYHVTHSTDWDVYGDIVEFRRMDDPSAQVLVRVTGWNDEEELRLDVTVASGVAPEFREFAVGHARELIGADPE